MLVLNLIPSRSAHIHTDLVTLLDCVPMKLHGSTNKWCFFFCCTLFLSFFFLTNHKKANAQELRIAVKESPPFVFENASKGFCIDLADIICKKYNVMPKYIPYRTASDLFKAVDSGECDLGLSAITITADRERRFDFSQPFFDAGLTIAVRTEQFSLFVSYAISFLRIVGVSLVIFVVGLTIIAHLIWGLEKDDSDDKSFSTRYAKGIIEAYWWAVVTMTTVGYGDKCPKKHSGRIIAALWMVTG